MYCTGRRWAYPLDSRLGRFFHGAIGKKLQEKQEAPRGPPSVIGFDRAGFTAED
jgi:hypothetical protein